MVLKLLEERPRPAENLRVKVKSAREVVRALIKRGWVTVEESQQERDPLRAPAERLEAEFFRRPAPEIKLKKHERELLAFLELHPGAHNVGELDETINRASEAARALARRDLIKLTTEPLHAPNGFERPVPVLNAHQEVAFSAIRTALLSNEFKSFLLQGVGGCRGCTGASPVDRGSESST